MQVSAPEVDGVLLLHPDVDQAVTFPLPDAKFGESVAAAVVLRAGASLRARDLKWFAFTHLGSHKIPQRIFFLSAIPKVARRALSHVLGLMESMGSARIRVLREHGIGRPLFLLGCGCVITRRPVFEIREPDLAHLPPPHTIEHVAAECIHALRRFQPEGPYALGASDARREVVFEIARQLEQAGERIESVALFKSEGEEPPPSIPYDRPHTWTVEPPVLAASRHSCRLSEK